MVEENKSQEFRLKKKIDETRNYFIEEIEQNELMSKKHKIVCTSLNYIEHFLILALQFLDVFEFLLFLLTWLSYINYEFCNKIKNLCDNCRNCKV